MSQVSDWTKGPAKWFAVGVLGTLSTVALTWSVVQSRGPTVLPGAPPATRRVDRTVPTQSPTVPTPTSTPSATLAAETPVPQQEPLTESKPHSEPSQPAPPKATTVLAHAVNINTAPAAEIELLPGIGPALAKRIIDERTANGRFTSVDDLRRVKGIGPKKLERIRDKVIVE